MRRCGPGDVLVVPSWIAEAVLEHKEAENYVKEKIRSEVPGPPVPAETGCVRGAAPRQEPAGHTLDRCRTLPRAIRAER